MKRQALRTLLALVLWGAVFGHSAGYFNIGLIDRLDAIAYDATLRLTAPEGIDDRVVIVDIDERSLEELGRWPWRRDRLAKLIDRIFDRQGAVLLGLDVILAEPDESSGLSELDRLAAGRLRDDQGFRATLEVIRPHLDFDQQLADAIARHPVVLAYHLIGRGLPQAGPSAGDRLRSVLPPGALGAAADRLPDWGGYKGSLPAFQKAAMGAGHINGLPDFDGVVRRAPLLVKVAGQYQEALGLAIVRVLAGNAPLKPLFASGASAAAAELDGLLLETPRGAMRIPVDAESRVLIPYRSAAGSFRYVSAADVLADRIPKGALAGRIVLLGTTAPGLVDLRVTPVSAAYPGVEIHANLISGILDGRLMAQPGYIAGLRLVLLALIGLIMIAFLPGHSPLRMSYVTVLLIISIAALHKIMWQQLDTVLPLAAPLVLVALLYGVNMIFGYFLEVHNRHSMARLFGQYVPPELVLEMSRDPDRYGMEGRSAELSVLFADIRGFTALSEGMSAQELARMMNEFFSAMAAVVREQRGTLDKYLGDAVMAFWGAPIADSRHAEHAVAAGLAMQARLAAINETFPRRGWPQLAIGIGINTGDMTVGDMGSSDRRAYTVLGDPVNLAARLVDLTAYYGAAIVIGEATHRALRGVACRELDRVTVQGRAGAVTLYEPLGPAVSIDPLLEDELIRWTYVLACYHDRQWDAAEEALRQLAERTPRRLYELYLERLASIRADGVPDDWDDVWRFGRPAH